MKVIQNLEEMQAAAESIRREGKRIGFVATMGFLHEGHLSLVRAAQAECEIVVVSIFVNPTQFGPAEDFDRYPTDLDRDRQLLEEEAIDILFAPAKADLYPEGFSTELQVTGLTDELCGASRPWHFPGVATIVCKLFHLVRPDVAWFGQKDYQQALVIKRMVTDLDFGIEIWVGPTIREPDGLAVSSRNEYLSEEERKQATVLVQALLAANQDYLEGERSSTALRSRLREVLAGSHLARVDYAEVVDAETLRPMKEITGKAAALVAVFFGDTRLIDNHLLGDPGPV